MPHDIVFSWCMTFSLEDATGGGIALLLLQTCRPARLGTQTPATCRWKMAPRMGGFLISVTRVTVRSSYLVRDITDRG